MSNHDSIVILGYDNPEIDKEVFSFQNGGVKAYLMQERIAFKESVQKEESMVYILGENVNTRVKSALVGKNPDVYTIGIVTFDNPMLGWKKDETYESQRNSFKVTLKSGSIKYVPLSYGTFGKKEDSFILFNINKETVEFLAKKFYQKSFIFGEKNKDIISYTLYECDEEKYRVLGIIDKYESRGKGTNISNERDAKDFFSSLKDYKFLISFDIKEASSYYWGEAFVEQVTIDKINSMNHKMLIDNSWKDGKSDYYTRIWINNLIADDMFHK
jgi:hypothetical protein